MRPKKLSFLEVGKEKPGEEVRQLAKERLMSFPSAVTLTGNEKNGGKIIKRD